MGKIELENLSPELQNKINSSGSGGGSGITLPISASDVTETVNRVFITPNEKAEIIASTTENASQTTRIASIENTLSTLSTTDEKVKMNSLGEAKYLEELIDDLTIKNKNGKLVVEALDGLLSTVFEINLLQGASSNIQAQINSLSNIGNYSTTVMDETGLATIVDPKPQDMVIVLSDGNHMGKSTIYIYNGTSWIYSGDFKGGEVRDFTTNPIDLSTETTGILQKSKYEKQNASETSFVDSNGNLVSTDTNSAILEVFRFADSLLKGLTQTVGYPLSSTDTIDISLQKFKIWWSGLANAITNKGISTSTSNNGNEMIQKIGAIPNISVSGGVRKISKFNAIAPYNLDIVLNQPLVLEDICTTLFEYIPGATGIVKYDVKFNNSDKTDFIDNEFVDFDGVAKLKKEYKIKLENVDTWTGNGYIQKMNFNREDFVSIDGFSFK